MDKVLIEECIALYKMGASRMQVARKIMEATGLKETAAKSHAKNIWDNHFDDEYIPIQQRESSEEEYKADDNSIKTGTAKFKQEGEEATAESKSSNIRTLEDLLRECEVDLDTWEVDKKVINKWEVAAKNSEGELVHSPLYQVKAWLKKREDKKIEKIANFIREEISKHKSPIREKKVGGKYMYEISMPDLHLAKMAWAKETGYQDYDIKIAADLYEKSFYELLSRVEISELDHVLIPIGNDFFNSEGLAGATTAGTRQDDDSRWPKSFQVGCNLITRIVDDLSKLVNVKIVIVPGNHDFERDFYLGEFLSAWYRNTDAVEINNSPTNRKYVEFGENLILFTHGNEEKQSDLPLLMATEYPNFSKCKFRSAHLGHLHQDWLREYRGIKVRILPSLCPPDSWHAKKGYVGNLRSAIGFLYDPVYGEVANYYYHEA